MRSDAGSAVAVGSVNVGSVETLCLGRRQLETGIRKSPVQLATITEHGVVGDVIADVEHHGGRDQAVYLYSAPDLAWWEAELGVTLPPGVFGENLTLSSFGERPVRIGDRFRIGAVVLEATAPRIPCGVFAVHVRQPHWVRRFAQARRPGFYARVLALGDVRPGDQVEILGGGESYPGVESLVDVWFNASPNVEILKRLLAAPLSDRARRECKRKLERVEPPPQSGARISADELSAPMRCPDRPIASCYR
jgi:MOSC domain-containing protein YiiM